MALLFFLAVLQADEIRRELPAAAGLPKHVWEALQKKPATIEEMNAKGLGTLTFAALSIPHNPEIELDFTLENQVSPTDLINAIGKETVTILQKEYVKEMTCQVDKDVATGVITAEIPKFGKLVANYTARKAQVTWKIVEFKLPKCGMVCARQPDDKWRIEWQAPQASTLSLVYSFGAIHAFGRKVFDYADGKWETLEKLLGEREYALLIVSGSGPGWTWNTVREILTRAKKIAKIKLRSGGRTFEVPPPAAAPDKPVCLHLCCGKKPLDAHVKDPEKHAKDVRKFAEEPAFGDVTYLWADEAFDKPIALSHPLSEKESLDQDRDAVKTLIRGLKNPPSVKIVADPQVSFDHVMLVASFAQKLGIKDVRLPD
jgi:hypothetical protein